MSYVYGVDIKNTLYTCICFVKRLYIFWSSEWLIEIFRGREPSLFAVIKLLFSTIDVACAAENIDWRMAMFSTKLLERKNFKKSIWYPLVMNYVALPFSFYSF